MAEDNPKFDSPISHKSAKNSGVIESLKDKTADPKPVVSETLAVPSAQKADSTEAAKEEDEDKLEQGDNMEIGTAEQEKKTTIPFDVDNPEQEKEMEEPPKKKKKTSKPLTGGRAP